MLIANPYQKHLLEFLCPQRKYSAEVSSRIPISIWMIGASQQLKDSDREGSIWKGTKALLLLNIV